MSESFYLINDLDTVDTSPAYDLGQTIVIPGSLWRDFCPAALASGEDDPGPATLVYGFNDEASTAFAIGEAAMIDTADYARGSFLRTTGVIAPHRVTGVAQWAVAAGSYAWFLKEGLGQIECDGSVTAGAEVTTAAAGQFTDVVANADATVDTKADAVGVAHATDAGASTLVRAYVNCPGG